MFFEFDEKLFGPLHSYIYSSPTLNGVPPLTPTEIDPLF